MSACPRLGPKWRSLQRQQNPIMHGGQPSVKPTPIQHAVIREVHANQLTKQLPNQPATNRRQLRHLACRRRHRRQRRKGLMPICHRLGAKWWSRQRQQHPIMHATTAANQVLNQHHPNMLSPGDQGGPCKPANKTTAKPTRH